MPLDLKIFNEISAKTPNLCHLAPARSHPHARPVRGRRHSGGAGRAGQEGPAGSGCATVTGKTLGENIQGAHILNEKAIRPIDNPYSQTGGLQILWGNLAPDGCVVKRSAVARKCSATPARPASLTARNRPSTPSTTARIHPGDRGGHPATRAPRAAPACGRCSTPPAPWPA